MKAIVVFGKDNQEPCSFYDATQFIVFDKIEGSWTPVQTIAIPTLNLDSPKQLRARLEALPPLLSDYKILAGGELTGLAFSVFDRTGFYIFSILDVREATLDGVWADVEAEDQKRLEEQASIEKIRPEATAAPGVYFLDLIKLQQEYPGVSSKKALLPFLEETDFTELHLIFRHIPPWLENSGRYKIDIRPCAQGVLAIIKPQ
ncbi:MAG: hypothetical protein LBQ33_04665 [Oscillospiraceae bacterium]|jgi:hypothetical protein|nr:hypothetical protein [Oscillospiraceae bacterium]